MIAEGVHHHVHHHDHRHHGHDRIHHGYFEKIRGLAIIFKAKVTSRATQDCSRHLQFRPELSWSTTFLSALAPPVTTLTVTTVTPPLAPLITTHHTTRGNVRTLLLQVSRRNNFGGEVQPFAEVVETSGGQGVVVVLPRELSLKVATGGERLASLDDLFKYTPKTNR